MGAIKEELGHIVQFKIQVFLPHATDGTSFNTHHIKSCALLLCEVKKTNFTDCKSGSCAIIDNVMYRKWA